MKKTVFVVLALLVGVDVAHAFCPVPELTGDPGSYQNQQLQQQYNACLQNDENQQQQILIQQQQLKVQQQQLQNMQQQNHRNGAF